MEYRVFKSKPEAKLFKLYVALGRYFNHRCNWNTPTGYHSEVGSVVPLLFQCLSEFWCKSETDYSKIIKK